MKQILSLFLLVLFLAACGGSQAEPTPTAVPPTNTPAPTAVPTATIAPTATAVPDLTGDFVPFNDEFQGIALKHPADWASLSFFFTILASSEALVENALSGETPEIGNGALLLIIASDTAELESDDPKALLSNATEEFEFGGNLEIINPLTVTRTNGQEIATLVAKGEAEGQQIVVLYAVVLNKELGRVAIVAGVTGAIAQEQQLPIMQAIVSTIEVGAAGELSDDFGGFFEPMPVAQIEPLPILLNETVTGELTGFDPIYYSFTGLPALAYDVIVKPLNDDLDLILDLVDVDGVSLLDMQVDETFYGGTEIIHAFQPAESGLFIVMVRGFAGGTGAFELLLREAADESESRLQGPGSELLATVTLESEQGILFYFIAAEGSEIDFLVSPYDDLDVVLAIYGEDENLLKEVDDSWGEESLVFIAPKAGTYALEVRGYAGASGTFDLSLVASPDVVLDLYDGDLVNGWLDDSGKRDYVIALEAGQALVVTAEPEAEFDLVIELRDENGQRLLDMDDSPRGGTETLIFAVMSNGLYTIHIRGFAGAAGGKFVMSITTD